MKSPSTDERIEKMYNTHPHTHKQTHTDTHTHTHTHTDTHTDTHTHTHQTTGSEDFELQKAFVSEMVRIFLFVPIITA